MVLKYLEELAMWFVASESIIQDNTKGLSNAFKLWEIEDIPEYANRHVVFPKIQVESSNTRFLS